MRPIFRLGILLVVVILACIPPSLNLQAQGTQCFGLSDADCKILKAADANIPKEVSFHHDSDFTASIAGASIKQTTTWKGTGLFALDPLPDDMSKFLSDVAGSLNDVRLTLDIQGSTTTGSSTEKFNTNYVIVDGNYYKKTTDNSDWDIQTLADLIDQVQGAATPSSNSGIALLQKIINDPAVINAVTTIPNIKNLFKIQKTTNTPTVDGQKQIEFLYTYDIKTLLTAKELYPVIKAIAKAGGAPGNLSSGQLGAVANLLAQAFNGSTLKIARWVGSKDSLYHGLTIDFLLKFDPSEMGINSDSVPSFTIQLHFQVRLSQIGKPVSITAPEDAAPPPTEIPKPTVKPSGTPKPSTTPRVTRTPTTAKQPTKTRTPTSSSGKAGAATPTQTAPPLVN